MRGFFAAITAALALVLLASSPGAQAGSSQSAPTKYSHNPNRGVSPVVWTRPVAIREFSSSSARPARSGPGR
jgi:hypothetical protein